MDVSEEEELIRTEISQLKHNFDLLVEYYRQQVFLKTNERDKLKKKLDKCC